MACNCFHGTAREDSQGNCFCDETDGTSTKGCDGVIIDGNCTGGIRGIPVVNEPLPQAGGYEQFGMYGQKRKITNACTGLIAPNGYQYILNSSGECVLAVKYDNDKTLFGSNNALSSLLGGGAAGGGLSDIIANNKGLIGLGIAGVIALFLFRDKDGTATSRTVISRKGIN